LTADTTTKTDTFPAILLRQIGFQFRTGRPPILPLFHSPMPFVHFDIIWRSRAQLHFQPVGYGGRHFPVISLEQPQIGPPFFQDGLGDFPRE